MVTITKPMALDESFNTTESTSRNQADVLAGIEQAIMRGFGQVANAVSYDNTDSGLTANNVQDAIDEVDDTVDGLVDDLAEISSDIESTKTVSGNPLTLTDAAPINAESLVVELEPKQDLHGYDYPWPGGAGKNKLNLSEYTGNSYALYGFAATISGEDVTVTLTNYSMTGAAESFEMLMNTDATFDKTGLSIKAFISAGDNYVSGVRWSNVHSNNNIAIDLQNLSQGLNATITMRIMVYDTSSGEPTTYEPYSNICPITGYTECEVDDVGKNLFDKTSAIADKLIDEDGTEIASYSYFHSDYIRVKGNESYYLNNVFGSASFHTSIHYDENKNLIGVKNISGSGNQSGTITTFENSAYMIVNGQRAHIDETQVTVGSDAPTSYEPYHSSNATIQFGQTVYGGRSNITDGGTDVTYGFITIDETASIEEQTSGNNKRFCITAAVTDVDEYSTDHICEMLEIAAGNNATQCYTEDNKFAVYAAGYIFISHIAEDVTALRALLAETPLKVAYVLNTASTIATPPTDLKLLKGTNNLSTNGTTITLGYQPDNVIGHTLEVAEDYTDRAVGKNILPMTLAGIKAANPHLTWTNETSFTSGNVTVTFQVAGGDIYGIHIVSTGSNGEFFNLCFDGVDYSRFDGCILSGCDVNDENKIYIAIRKYGGANYFAKNISGDTVINYTAGQKASIFVYLSSGSVDTVIKPMIRKPNMDNTYEPPKPSKEILMDLIAYLFTQI